MSITHSKFHLFVFLSLFLATPLSARAESNDTASNALKISATRLEWSLGPVSSSNKVTPGDALCYTIDISNLTKGEDGNVSFSIEAKMIFPENIGRQNELTLPPMFYTNQVFSDPKAKKVKHLSLGNSVLIVPSSTPETDCTVEMKVFDHISGQTSQCTSTVQVVPSKGLTITRPCLSLDPNGQWPTSGNLTLGQKILVHCLLVTPNQPSADRIGKVHLEVYSVPDNKLVFSAEPISLFGSTFVQRGVDPNYIAAGTYTLIVSETGKYNVRFIVRDNDSKELASKTFPIVVHDRVESFDASPKETEPALQNTITTAE